jgi:acyl-CoA thioesterase I
MRWRVAVIVLAGALAAACGGPADGERTSDRAAAPAAVAPPRADARAASTAPASASPARRVVFLGDSLTAGLGLPIDEAFPSLIARRLEARGHGWQVTNAGVSGDTSAGGLRRLDWVLEGGAAVVVVALGANDGLRGLPVEALEQNLDTIISRAKASGAAVVLAGMEAPPNTGPDYTAKFRQVYPAVAARHGVPLIPFLLDGVAGEGSLNQGDGIHPNQEGARRVADVVWKTLEPVIDAREKVPTE